MRIGRAGRWLLDHSLLMGWRFRALPPAELAVCLGASLLLALPVGVLIGLAAVVVQGRWGLFWAIEARALELCLLFALLFFCTGGLTGVYLVPLTLRLPRHLGSTARAILFFLAGAVAMAIGLRFYTPITGLPVLPGLGPVVMVANGVIVGILGVVIVRFHQLDAEMRQSWETLRRQQEREQELRGLAGRAELAALQAQIHPHFFFNTLNSISALIELNPPAAGEAVECLGRLFRYTFGASRRPQVRLREEWDFVGDYLWLEKLRLGDRLQLLREYDEMLDGWQIPGLLLQPLVENAIVHGIAPCPQGGRLLVRAVAMGPGGCRIDIIDQPATPARSATGTGTGAGHALESVRRRLELLYGGRHRFQFQPAGEDGAVETRVTIELERDSSPG